MLLIAGSPLEPGGAAVMGLVAGLFNWVVWITCWASRIKADESGIVVANWFLSHEIPWSRIANIVVEDGLEIETRGRDGKKNTIHSIHFGTSVIGSFTGYPTHVGAARELQRLKDQYGGNETAEAVVESRPVFPWPPLVVSLASAALVAATISGLHSIS